MAAVYQTSTLHSVPVQSPCFSQYQIKLHCNKENRMQQTHLRFSYSGHRGWQTNFILANRSLKLRLCLQFMTRLTLKFAQIFVIQKF